MRSKDVSVGDRLMCANGRVRVERIQVLESGNEIVPSRTQFVCRDTANGVTTRRLSASQLWIEPKGD